MKLKKILKSKIFIFILGGILFSTVSVYAVTYFPSNQVTYDNGVSGLKSTDVQGAIDELYNTCQSCSSAASGDYIYFTSDGTSSGDGEGDMKLYKVSKDGGKATQINVYLANNIFGNQTPFENFNNIFIVDNYIYFTAHGTDGSGLDTQLYRVSKDGGKATQINIYLTDYFGGNQPLEDFDNIFITDNYIYFTSKSGLDMRLYRVSKDGGAATLINIYDQSGVWEYYINKFQVN